MPLEKKFIRDGEGRLLGSITSGFAPESTVVRGAKGRVTGRASEQFDWTKDERGALVSRNTADPGLVVPREKSAWR